MRKWRKCNGRRVTNNKIPCHYCGTSLIDGKYYCKIHANQARRIQAITDKELNALLLMTTTAKPGQKTDYKRLWLTVVPRLLNEIKRLKGQPHE
jgi:hypothetical protein